ncbi:histidinol-phosphatase [Angustibacter aerolatus]|uniref:Histidinol-phosphatase n=1 Tax=Angustibacter aerolatus TaxID=1162965 RepID=A0ABQ6JJ05_9ACTN|nr:PHP domain-containing protein [Angustibacter aerolatus]GMA87839.1 histidinol-phosphatase [Angustibacter aerolatus]
MDDERDASGPGGLPADGHVHSEWSWDATLGSMEETCRRAVEIGLPAVAFTEHLDLTPFRAGFLVGTRPDLVHDGVLTAPPFDVEGFRAAVERCRGLFPGLRVLAGVEVGQPHLHRAALRAILSSGGFDRVIGSLHCLPDGDVAAEPWEPVPTAPGRRRRPRVPRRDPARGRRVRRVRGARARRLPAAVVAHRAGPFEPRRFEDEFRQALRAVAAGDRALELNTRLPLDPLLLQWFREEGGRRVTFGSDAHEPAAVGAGLADAAATAWAHGLRPGRRPEAPWQVGAHQHAAG